MLVHHYPSPLVDTALVKLPKKIIIQMKENYVYTGCPKKNALSELCCSSQSSSLHLYLGSEYLVASYEWRLEDWEEQHSCESGFFWDTL